MHPTASRPISEVHRYYTLSAASALFKYAELKLNISFANASLRIRFIAVDGTMMIDPNTARNLELTGNMTAKSSIHSLFGYVFTLQMLDASRTSSGDSVLNRTWTPMASRLLRTTLMAPSTGRYIHHLPGGHALIKRSPRGNRHAFERRRG
jgi:DNA mismatch repair protein MSH4